MPANITLSELRQRVAIKLKIAPENQSISLKQINRIVPLTGNEVTLAEFGIKNKSLLFLEQINMQDNIEENSSDDDASPRNEVVKESTRDATIKLSNSSNPKYFLKLGFMKKQLTGHEAEDFDDTAAIIDELIEKIKLDCNPTMFMSDYKQAKKELKDLNIKQDISIDSKSTNGWTCLHAACQYGNYQLMHFFLEDLKCNPNILSEDGWAALHIASHLGFYEIVNELLKHPKIMKNLIGDPERGTGLHCAVNAGHFKVVQMYLMNEVDFDIKNADGLTPKEVCKDKFILGLFERFEKLKDAGKTTTEKVENQTEEIKEQDEEQDEETTNKLEPNEVTIKFDVDKEEHKDPEGEDEKSEGSFTDTKESLVLEGEFSKDIFESEEYLDKILKIIDQFQDNKKYCGYLIRVGRYYLSSKERYFELDPVQGTFIKYRAKEDYPHKPRQILNLEEIVDISIISEGWFIKRDAVYFQLIDSKNEKYYFYSKEEKIVTFWVNEFKFAKSFSHWLKSISSMGYNSNKKFVSKYEQINNAIVGKNLPVEMVDNNVKSLKRYTSSMGSTDNSSGKGKISPVSSDASNEESKRIAKDINNSSRRDSPSPDSRAPMVKYATSTLDEDQDIGFKSFKILEVLGQGTFGKVFKVEKLDNGKIYAMKVLKKSVLARNKHLKYAITECNVLRRADHPFIIRLHFSFQTPDYLYMVLDY